MPLCGILMDMETEEIKKWISSSMQSCTLCPRKCAADRAGKKTGYCKMTDEIRVSRAALHMWEEPCISGKEGSGTVFFTGCNMGCVYCQNYKISGGREVRMCGNAVEPDGLSDIFLELAGMGANNINLVTPTHYIPQLAYAIRTAREKGLSVPIVYNTGGYERVESLKKLEGLIDIYLPDFKYMKEDRAAKYSMAPDYPQIVKAALDEMFRQVGEMIIEEGSGLMKKGMIVRHLVLPDTNRDTKQILRYLKERFGDRIYVSLMRQYTPIREQLRDYPQLWEKVKDDRYESCVRFAQNIGMTNLYIQEPGVAEESFIPDFILSE